MLVDHDRDEVHGDDEIWHRPANCCDRRPTDRQELAGSIQRRRGWSASARPLRFARARATLQTARAANARFLARICDRRRSAQPRFALRGAATRRERSTPTAGWARLERRDPSDAPPCCTFSARCTTGKHPATCTKTRRVSPCDNSRTERAESHARGCHKPGRRAARVRRSAATALGSVAHGTGVITLGQGNQSSPGYVILDAAGAIIGTSDPEASIASVH
jgi:hypothetical protein